MHTWLLLGIALVLLILIPITPWLVRVRIRVLRWMHWDWAAELLESHFRGWVIFFRMFLFAIASLLFYFGYTQSAG